ncbi:hypothetical protein UFOVP447_106 [uncultured Caudovirales phage]|uniref:Uncharacterized protein n=1 Tax=uncultured Caudovirales phage TaxID=2100421 RepID=A0A6J5MHY9_9CAUD|nr:hypothetical protein UFOVP447_106 [uncultured Caudovirales phage]
MKALIYSIIAAVLISPVPVYANPDPVIVVTNEDTRIKRTFRDRRHWQDRINDREGSYRERNSDGWFRFEYRPYVHPGRPQAEVNCKYVERIDNQGERSFHFVCP